MKKINTIHFPNSKSFGILTISQMAEVKGGADTAVAVSSSLTLSVTASTTAVSVGPISATLDDKRRDRPGGGISTH